MGFEQLEINRLTEAGEVKRRIRCLAGHVTVFRANSDELLKIFGDGLLGQGQQGERFSVLLDGAAFYPEEHILIGFGEKFPPHENLTVGQFLMASGIPRESMEALLLSHGLGGLSRELCSSLSPEEDRMIRLLASTFSPGKVVLMHDPFDIVPDTWRNAFARDITNFAWQKRSIVVVTKLSSRPEEWIENEIVARVQLEAPRKRTIGFGGDDSETQKMVETLRQQFRADSAAVHQSAHVPAIPGQPNLLAGERPTPTREMVRIPSVPIFRKPMTQRRFLVYGTFMAIVFMFAITATIFGGMSSPPSVRVVNPRLEHVQEEREPAARVADVPIAPRPQPPKPAAGLILDDYPVEIRDAVVQAFSDPDAALKSDRGFVSQKVAPKIIEQKQVSFMPPATLPSPEINASGGDALGQTADEEELAKRREEIRQRFLEAIQRQAAQQQDQ